MTDRVLIPFNGTLLALTVEAFAEAQEAARNVVTPAAVTPAAVSDNLLSAEQLAACTDIPASWWAQAARENRVPCIKIGRYTRFRLAEVAEHFSQPMDLDSLGAVRQWRKSRT